MVIRVEAESVTFFPSRLNLATRQQTNMTCVILEHSKCMVSVVIRFLQEVTQREIQHILQGIHGLNVLIKKKKSVFDAKILYMDKRS